MVRLLPALFIFAALLGCEAEDPQDVIFIRKSVVYK